MVMIRAVVEHDPAWLVCYMQAMSGVEKEKALLLAKLNPLQGITRSFDYYLYNSEFGDSSIS